MAANELQYCKRYYMGRRPSYLPHVRILAINADLIKWVEVSGQPSISGAGLWVIYSNNGVESPFDETKTYNIHIKEGKHVLVTQKEQSNTPRPPGNLPSNDLSVGV
jgi:hypothetical protein